MAVESEDQFLQALAKRLHGYSARGMASKCYWSKTVVTEIKFGRRLPTSAEQLGDILTAADDLNGGFGEVERQQWCARFTRLATPEPLDIEPQPEPEVTRTRPEPVPSDLPEPDPVGPPPQRSGRKRVRIAVIGGLALLVVLGLVFWAVYWPVLWPTTEVSGRVRCSSGAPVTGLWVQQRKHGGHFGRTRPAADGWFVYTGYALKSRPHSFHVGCGRAADGGWLTESWSGSTTTLEGSLICDGSPAAVSVSPYRGHCEFK